MKNNLLRFMILIHIFLKIIKKQCVLMKMGVNIQHLELMFILMIFLLAVEIDRRSLVDRGLIFEEKRQKAIEIELDCDFIKISVNNMKNDYDLDYGIDYI